MYECVWYRAVFTVWRRQLSYMRSSRVFTPAYYTVCTPSPRQVSAPSAGALPQDHAFNTDRLFSYFVCFYTHKRFVIDYRGRSHLSTKSNLWGRTCSSVAVIMPLPGAPLSPMTLLRCGNPERSQRFFAPLAPLCLLAALDAAVKAYWLTAGAVMFQAVFSPCESETPRAHGLPITGFCPHSSLHGDKGKKKSHPGCPK
ncbi:hypothetical protein EVAR_11830_1 [Eumeta japonica]|uniref:Uncharacterized protein n=1 Tax=Eumeta variegata TaxID=151549 RepID=A0A4C1YNZ2_EUMVA|nr:hypothetical protein EVAR_11830_1 [Eumeta japonica]